MNPVVYSVERDGKTVTVKSRGGAVGVALALYPDARKGVTWKESGKVTELNGGQIVVREIDIPLAWVKWAPA